MNGGPLRRRVLGLAEPVEAALGDRLGDHARPQGTGAIRRGDGRQLGHALLHRQLMRVGHLQCAVLDGDDQPRALAV